MQFNCFTIVLVTVLFVLAAITWQYKDVFNYCAVLTSLEMIFKNLKAFINFEELVKQTWKL